MIRKIIFAVLAVFMAASAYSQSKFYVEDIVIPPNEQKADLVIKYEFDVENSYTSYSFDLILPEGISIVKNARGKYVYQLGDCHEDTHSLTINYVEDENLYGIACLSLESDPLFGKSGVLMTIPIQAENPSNSQVTHQGKIQEIKLVPLDGSTSQRLDESAFNVTWGIPTDDAVTITANNITREYGEKNPDFSYTVTKGSIKGGTPKITCEANEFSPAGTYAIKIEKGSVTNKDVALVDGTLTITKAPLTAKAKSYTRYQGEANPIFEIEFSGFKNGENENALTKKPTATTTATAASDPGTYPITPSGGESKNYNFKYVNGTLTIKKQEPILVNKITLNQTSAELTISNDKTLKLIATVLPENATDKSVTWTSSKTSVATVSNTGLVTAVAAGSATITCTANDGSGVTAICSITVNDSPDIINEGRYYLRNVASGLFITNGGNWGTHIAVDKRGLDLNLRKSQDGKLWRLYSGFLYSQSTEGALGTEGYVDNGIGIDHEITQLSDGIFTIKADNGFLLTTNDKNNLADFEGESASDKRAQWEFVKADEMYAQRMAALSNASSTNPADATFLIQSPNINNARDIRLSAWNRIIGSAYCNYGISDIDTEPIMEIFRNGDIMCSNSFSVSQVISLIPGYYKLEAQGFYRDGGYSDATTRRTNGDEQIDAYLFAGDKQIPLKSIFDDATSDREKGFSIKTTHGYIPNTMTEAGYTFQTGAYNNELMFYVSEESGEVEIGIRGDESFHYNNWTAFDNFQLTYYGEENPNPNKPILIAEDGIIDIDHNVNPGMLRINLDNPGVTVYGFSFTVNLPEHVSIESAELGRRCEGDKWEIESHNIPGSSTSRVVCYNLASEPIKDESGLICTLMLKAEHSAEDGTHPCSIRAIELTSKDASGSYPVYPGDAIFNLTIVNDIETITLGEDTIQPVYTLQGIRTTSPKRGIYIRNGKKVVVK